MAWEDPFLDGYDHYTTSDLLGKWSYKAGDCVISSAVTRNSIGAMRIGATTAAMGKTTPEARNFCVGTGYYAGILPTATTLASSNATVLAIITAFGQNSATAQLALCLLDDRKFRIVRTTSIGQTGSTTSGVELGVGSLLIDAARFYYLEWKVFLDDTGGKAELKIDGIVDITLDLVDTVSQASNTAGGVMFRAGNSNAGNYFDDTYIRVDSAATTATAGGYLGDLAIKPYVANADGTFSQWTPSSGVDHYALIDEADPNTTDYVSSATALQRDSFTFAPSAETATIAAVQMCAYAYKADSGFRGIELSVKSGVTEEFTPYTPLSVTPRYVLKSWAADPNTGVEWSQANRNAAEFGIRVAADL